jgi:hydroxymethylbilane synthase
VFALATLQNETVQITGGIISLNGKQIVKKTLQRPVQEAVALGQQLAAEVMGAGGEQILQEIRSTLKGLRTE